MKNLGTDLDVYDPYAEKSEVFNEFGFELSPKISTNCDAVILAVGHDKFRKLDLAALKASANTVVFDIKSFFPRHLVTAR